MIPQKNGFLCERVFVVLLQRTQRLDVSRRVKSAPRLDQAAAAGGYLRNLVARERYEDVGDLTLALQFGETFGYDNLSSGGMADIQINLGKLPEAEVQAISEYLLSLTD